MRAGRTQLVHVEESVGHYQVMPHTPPKLAKVRVRAQTAEELHRWDWMAKQKELGVACNATQPETSAA